MWSLVLVLAASVLLAWVVVRTVRRQNRFRTGQRAVVADVRARIGLLQARAAALRVAVSERWKS
ncbi:bacteriophage holin [Bounagaea algeriensis]